MKNSAIVIAMVLLIPADAMAQADVAVFPIGSETSGQTGLAAIAGPVNDAEKALAVARPILISVYGRKHIQREEPLIASRKGDVWFVEGTLNCPDLRPWWQKLLGMTFQCMGGTAELKLSAKTGAVLSVTHYQ